MKVEISIPETLDEIPLEQYQRFAAIDSNAEKDYQARKMLEIFCGVKDTLKVKKTSVDKVYNTIVQMFNKQYPLVTTFKIEGIEFGFIPNLEQITFGEYLDLDNTLSWPTMHKAMAILYRPITEKGGGMYKIEEYQGIKHADLMLKAPTSAAVSAMVFFWTLANDLCSVILSQTKEKGNIRLGHNLPSDGDGFQLLTDLVEEISQKRKELTDYQQANAFLSLVTSLQKIS